MGHKAQRHLGQTTYKPGIALLRRARRSPLMSGEPFPREKSDLA